MIWPHGETHMNAFAKLIYATLFSFACCLGGTNAEEFPTRPITLVVGLAAGGSVDIQARMFAAVAATKIGQPIIIENKGGGGGVPAAASVKRAPPDGYTLMVMLGATHSVPTLALPFDPLNDFEPIISLYSQPGFVVVPRSLNVSSVEELIALGKRRPGGLTYGSPSAGSPGHIMGALFGEFTGVKMTHVPYRGGGQMMADLVTGVLDVCFPTYTNFQPFLADKTLIPLAILQSSRWEQMPAVPTLSERGYKDVDFANIFGIAGPKGIPSDIVQRLNGAFLAASQDEALLKRMEELGAVMITSSDPSDFIDRLKADNKRLTPIVQKIGIGVK